MSDPIPQIQMRCLRCDAQMELRDPAPGTPWTPQQFWVCPSCGRHFWTTHPQPAAAKSEKADAPPATT